MAAPEVSHVDVEAPAAADMLVENSPLHAEQNGTHDTAAAAEPPQPMAVES